MGSPTTKPKNGVREGAAVAKTKPMSTDLSLLLLQAPPDFFRSIGKIYVVVAVIAIVLIGFFVSLYLVERRISKLENQVNQDE